MLLNGVVRPESRRTALREGTRRASPVASSRRWRKQCSLDLATIQRVSLNDHDAVSKFLHPLRRADKRGHLVTVFNRLPYKLQTEAPGGAQYQQFHHGLSSHRVLVTGRHACLKRVGVVALAAAFTHRDSEKAPGPVRVLFPFFLFSF
jgi:hypothetical protein